jgi:hypothetical protein
MSRFRDFPDGKTTWLRFRSIAEAATTMQKVEGNVYMPHATYVPQPSAGCAGELRERRHNLTIAVPVHLLLLRLICLNQKAFWQQRPRLRTLASLQLNRIKSESELKLGVSPLLN